jgi:hypothetical protein
MKERLTEITLPDGSQKYEYEFFSTYLNRTWQYNISKNDFQRLLEKKKYVQKNIYLRKKVYDLV